MFAFVWPLAKLAAIPRLAGEPGQSMEGNRSACGWHRQLAWFMRHGVIVIAVLGAMPALAQDAGRDAFVTRGALAGDQLWLRNDQGELSTIRVNGKERVPRPIAQPVADICAFDGAALAVSVEDDGTWVVFRLEHAEQERVSIKPVAPNGGPILDCRSGVISIIGSQQLATLDRFGAGAVPHTVKLSKPIGRGISTAVYGDAGHLYVGTGNGEFGGGLWVVDRFTGVVTGGDGEDDLMRGCDEAAGELGCSSINDFAAIPWKPGCVAVAIGLQHMMSSGALVELCGSSFRQLYRSPYTSGWMRSVLQGRRSPETVPFYGLLAKPGSLLVAGLDRLYEIGPKGLMSTDEYPEFTSIGGVDVSFGRPDVILVRTAVSQHKALSSETPLMVPR